jgi:hypothetical protein
MQIRHVLQEARKVKEPHIDNVAKKVYQQLLPDFPAPALEFVKRTNWIGPVEVSPDMIDTSNRANWKASHEPDKVKMHQKLIKEGESQPIILAKVPDNDKFIILDAHHRFLAYEAMDRDPVAYIGDVRGTDIEPALILHSKQYHGGSKLDGTAGQIESDGSES